MEKMVGKNVAGKKSEIVVRERGGNFGRREDMLKRK